ncbi:hypothetical protein V1508DRAFT_416377 [Lipomyces doorenjongii]|uniref:uncharacterized protein n=1 Tax=Lipomyces doorenjongii TaxID=383834 RepID=UPI0034CD8A43
MSDAPPSHLPGQEPCQPVSRSSSVGSSTSTALSVPSLVRSQSLPVQLPPASASQQHALSAQTLPSPLRENVVPSPMRLNAIMAPSQSPYVPPYNLAGHRIQQQLPPLTSAFARRMSLPPLLWFGEGQHQFLTPTPNLPPVQPSGPLSDAASQQLSSSSTSADREMRRTKSHVVTACSNCKKAHLACDVARPCQRCINLGKQDTCVDVRHKKRGRPRIRDDPSSTPRSSSTSASSSPSSSYSIAPLRGQGNIAPGVRMPPSGGRLEHRIHSSPQFSSNNLPPSRSPSQMLPQLSPLSTQPVHGLYTPRDDLYIIARWSRELQIVQLSEALRTRISMPATLGEVLPPNSTRDDQISQALVSLGTSDEDDAVVNGILIDTSLAELVRPVLSTEGPAASGTSLQIVARQISADPACAVVFVRAGMRGRIVEYVVVRILEEILVSWPMRRGFGLGDILA